ncbi:MAG TPA: type IV secretion system DNA-binding domain-containing protein [Steroidobacteraceae bacterium]|nr:type IV secretion system DNA-binding domain-containing protein [Steroidobacteraceae bacterium]
MSDFIQMLTQGTRGIELAYLVTLGGLLVANFRARVPWRAMLPCCLWAIAAFLTGVLALLLLSPLFRGLGFGPFSPGRLLMAILVFGAAGYLLGRHLTSRRSPSAPLHRRGAIVLPRSAARRQNSWTGITLAGVPLTPEDETKHFKLIGTTGTGKSTAIQEILRAALRRGDRAIIADPDGGYLSRFYEPGRDVILNPFDGEARKWDLFGEITQANDIELLTHALIPDRGGRDSEWNGYARTFLMALLQQARKAGARNDAELYRLVTTTPIQELRIMLSGTSAAPFVQEGNDRMFGSIRSVAASTVQALQYATIQQATPLSVRQWVRGGASRQPGGRGGVLFLPYSASEVASLASLISAWMRLGIVEAMEAQVSDQHLWFIVDELDALGEIDGLKDALTRLRKFGGRCVLGFQSIAQVSATYGSGVGDTIVENCGNTLILKCSASERGGTAEFASKLIGQREVLHTTQSRTRRPTQWMSSTTTSRQIRTEPAVMASEIERLPDLTGYLKVASKPDWIAVALEPSTDPVKPRERKPVVTIPAPPTPPSPAGSPSRRPTKSGSGSSGPRRRGLPIPPAPKQT